jgi:hypothetical protein
MQRDSLLLIEAVRESQPDTDCIAAGDEHAELAVRCFAAAGLGDAAIEQRMRLFVVELDPLVGCDSAAFALARHGVIAGAPAGDIVGWLALLALEGVPAWPDDPEKLAWITRTALGEAGR